MNHKSLSRILLVLVVMVVSFTATCFAQYQETVLYQFNYLTGDSPAGIVFDTNGNILGTTSYGAEACGCGTVFELSPTSSGSYTFQTIYRFSGGSDGGRPFGLTLDANGN